MSFIRSCSYEARKNDEFWVEDAKFKFSLELAKNLNEQKLIKLS
jgi:hypothetical protein